MEKRRLVPPVIIYGMVWLACLVFYWGSLATGALGGGGIMGYVILTLHIALPIAAIVSAFLIGRTAELGWWRLVALITIAVLYVLHTVATFSLSNALGLTNIAPADLAAFMYGLPRRDWPCDWLGRIAERCHQAGMTRERRHRVMPARSSRPDDQFRGSSRHLIGRLGAMNDTVGCRHGQCTEISEFFRRSPSWALRNSEISVHCGAQRRRAARSAGALSAPPRAASSSRAARSGART